MNKTKKIFSNVDFALAMTTKMFSIMAKEKRKIGLREFAKMSGISSATLSRIMNKKSPDVETFLRLCVWLNCDPKTFIIK